MEQNPYESPQSRFLLSERRPVVWPFVVASVILFAVAVASAIIFVRAGWYRLSNTEAMGRYLVPPPIPLDLVDRVLLICLLVGFLTVALALWASLQAMQRWSDSI
jgi:hypothetical protein